MTAAQLLCCWSTHPRVAIFSVARTLYGSGHGSWKHSRFSPIARGEHDYNDRHSNRSSAVAAALTLCGPRSNCRRRPNRRPPCWAGHAGVDTCSPDRVHCNAKTKCDHTANRSQSVIHKVAGTSIYSVTQCGRFR